MATSKPDPSTPDPSTDAMPTASAPTNPNPANQDSIGAVPASRYILFAFLAIVGGVADLWTKQAVFQWRGLPGQREVYWVIDGYFGIETAVNIGAVFGIGAGKGILFAGISVFALIAILLWLFWFRGAVSKWLTFAMGCITGGIIGNFYDRIGMWWQPGYPEQWQSGVRDWILWQASDQWRWPNFNIADSLLVTGAIMLVVQSIFFPPPGMVPPKDAVPDSSDDTSNSNTAAN
ncbi:signal peptidase II [Neorhodopirellula lusitana]|uniref:signal peptidase II n=1 Tax=Neorhodopirellula lusitana TaxID=445327 RepID=UPI00385034EC